MKKELRLKQKTLSTYEYLLKLPAEQETEFFKCKQCPKFFISKPFLQKHYDKNHGDKDFFADFKDEKGMTLAKKERETREHSEAKNKEVLSDELFNKIRGELSTQLKGNMNRIEAEISDIKMRQT